MWSASPPGCGRVTAKVLYSTEFSGPVAAYPLPTPMTRWLKRLRGALGMGVTWAVTWAATGLLIGVSSVIFPGRLWDAFFVVFDAPLPALAVPGFVGGVLFSLVLGVAGRHRHFEDLSLPRFAALGAIGGLLLSLVPDTMVALGIATLDTPGVPWQLAAIIGLPLTAMSALSASGSLLLARRAEERAQLTAHRDTPSRLSDDS